MLNYLRWKIYNYNSYKILKNDFFGVQITYFWNQKEWDFFLHPVLDTNNNSLYYLWFDDIQQLDIFYKIVKISWIWWKTACYMTTFYPLEKLKKAIWEQDLNFFKTVPWIGSKTAKKIIIELKDKVDIKDFENQEQLNKQKETILKWIVWLWYPKEKVKKELEKYSWDLSDVQLVIKDIIKRL